MGYLLSELAMWFVGGVPEAVPLVETKDASTQTDPPAGGPWLAVAALVFAMFLVRVV